MKRKVLIIIISIVVVLTLGSICLIHDRYKRDLPLREDDSSITISDRFFTKVALDFLYNSKRIGFFFNRSNDKNKIMFLGDSITDYCDLNMYYPSLDAINYGISGDTTRGVLNRLEDVYKVSPKLIVLLIGTNDMMNEKRDPLNIIKDYELIVDEIKDHLPSTKIILESVYPGCDGNKEITKDCFEIAYMNEDIDELNLLIKDLAFRKGLTYIDVNSLLKDSNGLMDKAYSDDGCHPNDFGYNRVKDTILNAINDELE